MRIGRLLGVPCFSLAAMLQCSPFAACAGTLERAARSVAPPAYQLTVLHTFVLTVDGGPVGDLVSDASGALYGVTGTSASVGAQCPPDCNGGNVYRLTPPNAGQTLWNESLLFVSNTTSFDPFSGLLLGAHGVLYGTTFGGGGNSHMPFLGYGGVYAVTPPASGQTAWTTSDIAGFSGANGDGAFPYGNLIADASGALYGTTYGGGINGNGTVFKLTPPAVPGTNWTESVLYRFLGTPDGSGPEAGLVADAGGALYGTTFEGGVHEAGIVYRLAPHAGTWTETVLHTFNDGPHDGGYPTTDPLAIDAAGSLYGTTQNGGISCLGGCGVVYKLTPPAPSSKQTSWSFGVLHAFAGGADGAHPTAGLTIACGKLYGVIGGGANARGGYYPSDVFTLNPPPAGQTAWTESIIYRFGGNIATAVGVPDSRLLTSKQGALYGTTLGGSTGYGTVFELSDGRCDCR